MSINSLLSRKYLPELAGYRILLQAFAAQWNLANTLSERIEIEADTFSTFRKLLDLSYELESVTQFAHPVVGDFVDDQDRASQFLVANITKLKALTQMYLELYNNQQLALLELTGRLRRAKQKKAVLALWDDNLFKHVVAEGFLNLDKLNTAHGTGSRCWVDTMQGVLTLPKISSSKKIPHKIKIAASSNGQPGNSDEDITTNNIRPSFMLDGNPDTWFEYEKLDTGPLTLSVFCEFSMPTIINEFIIAPAALGTGVSFEIVDVLFNAGGEQELSLRDLVRGTVPEEFWTVKTVGNDIQWAVTFLPVKCQEVVVKLKQEHSYIIRSLTRDMRSVERSRYSIGIKNLYFNQAKYQPSGGIGSVEDKLPRNLFACSSHADVFPGSASLFKAALDVSFDGGESWKTDVLGIPSSEGTSVVLNGNEESYMWRLQLSRNDDAFRLVNSYTEDDIAYDTDSIVRGVSKLFSPARIPLVDQPYNNEVFVLQPNLLTRASKMRDAIVLGRNGSSPSATLPFPIDIIEEDIDPDEIHIWVNGLEWERVSDENSLGNGKYMFREKYTEVTFIGGLDPNSTIKASMDPERMLLTEKSDGYYHEMEHLFDATKERIRIEGLNSSISNKTMVLPRGVSRIDLGHRNIIDGSIVFLGLTLTKVNDRASLTSSNTYFLDTVNGILHLYEGLTAGQVVTVKFQYQGTNKVGNNSFDLIMDGVRPLGVRIAKDALVAETLTDIVEDIAGGQFLDLIDVRTGLGVVRPSSFAGSNRALALSRDYIVRGSVVVSPGLFGYSANTKAPSEVSYINGYAEFLGLLQMENEVTAETAAGASNKVVFTVAAGAAYHSNLDITFSNTTIFNNKKNSASDVLGTGDWHIDNGTGSITVWVETGKTLPGGINLYYYYRDPDFDSANLFSVDYKRGIFYSSEDMVDSGKISYKASNYMVEYQIGAEVNAYTYDPSSNVVTVTTEGLSDLNSTVKIIWAESPIATSLEEMREYFSPLVSTIALRFE